MHRGPLSAPGRGNAPQRERACDRPTHERTAKENELRGEVWPPAFCRASSAGREVSLVAYHRDDEFKVGNRRQGDPARESPTAAPSRPKPRSDGIILHHRCTTRHSRQ